MKHGKRPTRKQKLTLSKAGLNPDNWLIEKSLPGVLYLVHRMTGNGRVLRVG